MEQKIDDRTVVTPAGAEPPLVLAIDIGSSSTRALLYDRLGRQVGSGSGDVSHVKYRFSTGPDGTSEDNPNAAIERLFRCIDLALRKAGPLATQIGAVAVDTLVTNILAIDSAGRPLTPLISYADTRDAVDAETLRGVLDEAAVQDRTGCLLRSSYWPARLAWFRRVHPDLWRDASRWITLGEFLELNLFGRSRVTFSAASWSGLLDRRKLTWDEPLLDLLGVKPEQLSKLVDVDAPLQGLSRAYAARWPALPDVPWFPAVGDGAAANVGSGCTSHSRVALTIGTTGAMRSMQPEVDHVPWGLWCYRVNRRYALLGGATSEGGNVHSWLRRAVRLGNPDKVEAALAAYTPDSHGLTLLPFLAGERSPNWAGNVPATINGLTLNTAPLDILRASLEAVAYRFATIEQRICSAPSCDHVFIASGGALLKSPTWMQIFADVLGRRVVASAEPEATSRGTALLALHALKVIPSLQSLPAADGTVYDPNPHYRPIYDAAIARQSRLYDLVAGQQ